MKEKDAESTVKRELDDEEKIFIRDIFFEEIVPKLRKMHARIGNLNCGFAGKKYENWNIRFRSDKSGFDIVDFEYDENSRGFSLDI